jgi:type VI secretion system protein ImpH
VTPPPGAQPDAPAHDQAAPGAATTAAPTAEPPADALARLLADVHLAPWSHDFFALLRRVEALSGSPGFGRALRPSQEPLRLGQEAELDFASAPITRLELDRPFAPRLGVRFFGLLGPQGALPLHLTSWVRDRQRNNGDDTAARFLDLFHHRMLALLYRTWADAQPVVQHDRPERDRYAVWLGAQIGLAGPAPHSAQQQHRRGSADHGASRIADHAQLHQAGLLVSRSRHPEGLASILRQHFGVPVRIEEHVPHWLGLEIEDRSRLGWSLRHPRSLDTPPALLGRNTVIGHKRWDRQFKFRIVLGPLDLANYRAFLPGQPRGLALADWVCRYVGRDLGWELALRLHPDHLPEPRLGRGVALGHTSWLVRPGAAGRTRRQAGVLRLQPSQLGARPVAAPRQDTTSTSTPSRRTP